MKNEFNVAIIGNPNTGKTSIFNALANQNQKVGNWAGVTVDSKAGVLFEDGETRVNIVDLPGIYSLRPRSEDEIVASEFILKSHLSLVIVVLDASRLERSLYLYAQIREMGQKTFVILNMNDVAKAENIIIDVSKLEKTLGCPVFETIANRKMDILPLKNRIIETIGIEQNKISTSFRSIIDDTINKVADEISDDEEMLKETKYVTKHCLAVRIVENGLRGFEKIGNFEKIKSIVDEKNREAELNFNVNLQSMVIEDRWKFVENIADKIIKKELKNLTVSEKIDRVLMNKFIGIPVFLFMIFLMFSFVYILGDPIVGFMEDMLSALGESVNNFMTSKNMSPIFTSLLVDGIIGGVGNVLVFFPNIFLLFLFLGFMEDSGYLSRGAFLLDRLMVSFGMHGKSFISLMMGFGCSVPALMSTRILNQKKDRLITMLTIPFMSCSAKLPVFILFASIFFPKHSALVVFLLYIIGIFTALIVSKILSVTILKGETSCFFMELPPYHVPVPKNVLKFSWQKSYDFIKHATGFIAMGVLVLWFMGNLPFGVEYASENSLIGIIGDKIKFIFEPAGYGFWQASVALIFGVMAKEIIIASLATLFSVGGDGLGAVLMQYFTPLSAFSFLIMVLLYTPCIGTVATFRKETKSWGWTAFMIGYTFLIGLLASVLVYRIGLFLLH